MHNFSIHVEDTEQRRFIKKSGGGSLAHPAPPPPYVQCLCLCKEDFVLALQTPLQVNMMKKHANGRVICIDTTHGTNGYDFTLISVLIVNEYGEGFSVAWVISNREDQILLMNFFRALKRRIGVVSPAYIISDLAEQFHTAWMAMFGNSPTKLVCVWHVDRAWRENI